MLGKKPSPEDPPSEPQPKKREDELEEFERVALWRLCELMDAGYPLEIAEQIGRRFDIDAHLAIRLLDEGCPPVTAARILL